MIILKIASMHTPTHGQSGKPANQRAKIKTWFDSLNMSVPHLGSQTWHIILYNFLIFTLKAPLCLVFSALMKNIEIVNCAFKPSLISGYLFNGLQR